MKKAASALASDGGIAGYGSMLSINGTTTMSLNGTIEDHKRALVDQLNSLTGEIHRYINKGEQPMASQYEDMEGGLSEEEQGEAGAEPASNAGNTGRSAIDSPLSQDPITKSRGKDDSYNLISDWYKSSTAIPSTSKPQSPKSVISPVASTTKPLGLRTTESNLNLNSATTTMRSPAHSNVAPPRPVLSNSGSSSLQGDGTESTSNNIIIYGNNPKVIVTAENCGQVAYDAISKYYSTSQEIIFRSCARAHKNYAVKMQESYDVLHFVLTDLCIDSQWPMMGKLQNSTVLTACAVIFSSLRVVKCNAGEAILAIEDAYQEQIEMIHAELMANISQKIQDRVTLFFKTAKEAREAKNLKNSSRSDDMNTVVRSRRTLSVASEDEDDEDDETAVVFDADEIRRMKKRVRESRRKLSGHKGPLETALSGPGLTYKRVSLSNETSKLTIDPVLENFINTKNYAIRIYSTSRTATAFKVIIPDSERNKLLAERIKSFILGTYLLEDCSTTPNYVKHMIGTCTKVVVACEASGQRLCCNLKYCGANSALDKDAKCVEDTCDKYTISLNSDSYAIKTDVVKSPWNNTVSAVGSPRSEGRTICSISGIDLSQNNASCAAGKTETIFSSINYYTLSNGTQLIGTPLGFRITNHISKTLSETFTCTPSGSCSECFTSDGHCNGDDNYCKFEGIACDADSDCFCKMDDKGEREAFVESVTDTTHSPRWAEIKNRVQIWAEISYLKDKVSDSTHTKDLCSLSTVCNTGEILVTSSCDLKSVKALICNRVIWVQDKAIKNKKSVTIAVPWDLVLSENEYQIHAHFVDHEQVIKRTHGSCHPFRVCSRINCLFCWKNLKAPRCWTTGFVISLFTIIPSSLLLILWVLARVLLRMGFIRTTISKTLKFIWFAFCPFHFFFLLLLRQLKKGKESFKNVHARLSDHHERLMGKKEESESDLRSVVTHRIHRPARRALPPHLHMFNLTLCVLSVIAFLPPSEQCHEATVLSISNKDCRVTGASRVCSLKTDSLVNIGPGVAKLCFMLKDEEGKIVDMMTVNLKGLRLECNSVRQYFTFDPKVRAISQDNCYSRGICYNGPSTLCRNFLNNSDDVDAVFPSSIGRLRYPVCSGAPGCAANGCVTCSERCVAGVAILENVSDRVFEVISCSQWTYGIKGSVEFPHSGTTIVKKFSLFGSTPVDLDPIHISLNSITTPPSNLVNKCFLLKEGSASMLDCQMRGSMKLGVIGELRCPSEKDARVPSNKCSFVDQAITSTRAFNEWVFKLSFLNISRMHSDNILPISYGSYLLEEENGRIVSSIPDNSMVQLHLQTRGMSISYKPPEYGCLIKKLEISGCFACSEGANLSLEIGTREGPDSESFSLVVECPKSGIGAYFSSISTNKASRIVHTGVQSIQDECTVHCGTKIQNITLNLKLEEKIGYDPRASGTMIISEPKEELEVGGDLSSFQSELLVIIKRVSLWFLLAVGLILLGLTVVKLSISLIKDRAKSIV